LPTSFVVKNGSGRPLERHLVHADAGVGHADANVIARLDAVSVSLELAALAAKVRRPPCGMASRASMRG